MQIDTLIRMGHEIARNNAALPHEEAVERVARHLRSFWAPAMIAELEAFAAIEPERLDPVLREALSELADRRNR